MQKTVFYVPENSNIRIGKASSLNKFQPIGKISNKYIKELSTDIFGLLRKVTKTAYDLFDDLKQERDPETNIAYLPFVSKTTVLQRKRNRYLQELKELNIVKKLKVTPLSPVVQKSTYMINPNLIMCFNQTEAIALWNIL